MNPEKLPKESNGIVWIHNKEREKNVFNEPWMKNLDQNLLFRYWKKKGYPGYLFTWLNGTKLWHRYSEDIGLISFVSAPLFDQL